MSDSVTLWAVACFCPWDSPGKNPGVGCHFLLHPHPSLSLGYTPTWAGASWNISGWLSTPFLPISSHLITRPVDRACFHENPGPCDIFTCRQYSSGRKKPRSGWKTLLHLLSSFYYLSRASCIFIEHCTKQICLKVLNRFDVHRVGEAIQPSHPLSSPSPPAPNPSQHQGLFQ